MASWRRNVGIAPDGQDHHAWGITTNPSDWESYIVEWRGIRWKSSTKAAAAAASLGKLDAAGNGLCAVPTTSKPMQLEVCCAHGAYKNLSDARLMEFAASVGAALPPGADAFDALGALLSKYLPNATEAERLEILSRRDRDKGVCFDASFFGDPAVEAMFDEHDTKVLQKWKEATGFLGSRR